MRQASALRRDKPPRYIARHGQETAPDILRIAVAQLNPTVGDIAGNLAKAREARADAARQGADLVLFTELFIAGYPPEDLVLKPAFLAACEKAVERFRQGHRRWRAGRHHRHAAEAQERRPQFGHRRRRRQDHRRALQGRPAELWRVRREARLPGRSRHARAGEFPRRAARHPDLRGHLGRSRRLRDAGRKRRRNPAGAERLALLSRQGRRAPPGRHPAGDRDRPADALCQPARRPGRTGLRRRVLRHQCRQVAGLPDEPVRGDAWPSPTWKRDGDDGWVCVDGPMSKMPGEGGGRLSRLHAGPARLCEQERLQERRARPFGRHQFGDLRRARRRCAGRGARCAR